ncbi:hypothetical protein GCM10011342_20700 [Aquisalinus flavus]|uniref:Triosephosphate isomerase n=2 Tax=Aquisalinus flavus TaxID=1526572 RepID=A0A8J2V5G9_9PROT|nr:hypothetical protein GCM10011342_20700 [Aquisalinus flavus]
MARESLPQSDGPFLLAYEPVWAIGSGRAASVGEISAMHDALRNLAGPQTPLLYGGSVKPENAGALAEIRNVDGFLVGGASLDPETFIKIAAQLNEAERNCERASV